MIITEPYNGNEPYIFISYSRADFSTIARLIEHLQLMSIRVWYGNEDEPADDNLEKAIADKIERCSVFLPILTDNYYISLYALEELQFADRLQKNILPVILDEFPIPEDLYPVLGKYQSIEKYRMLFETFYQNMLDTEIVRPCIENLSTAQRTAYQKNEEVIFHLGEDLFWDQEIPQHYEKAASYFQCAAQRLYPDAQYMLGHCYEKGIGVSQNYASAVFWYLLAAKKEHAAAQNNLFLFCKNDPDAQQSCKKTVNRYLKEAEQGDAHAYYELGFYYEYGLGVIQSYEKAAECYQKAAKLNRSVAFNAEDQLTRMRKKGLI